MTKSRRLVLYLYLLFAGIGLQFELGDLAEKEVSLEVGRDLVLNFFFLAVFLLALYYFVYKTAKKLSVSLLLVGVGIFGGAFVAGWLSFAGNSLIDMINAQFIKDPVVFNDWTNALTAPFSEEFFKALLAFVSLYILDRKDLASVFIAGLSSGLGFQIIEDVGYVARQTLEGESSGALEALGRMAGGLASHTLYTAIVTVGVYLLLSSHYQKQRRFALWCIFSTVANHFIWNSPFYETEHRINLVVGLLFAFLVGTFIELYSFVHKESQLELETRT